ATGWNRRAGGAGNAPARRARPQPGRSASHAGSRRGLRRFHRADARRSGRGDSQSDTRPRVERKGISGLNNLLVMKFGGTSVGTAGRMRVAARISADLQKQRPVAIVVSAMSKITDLLLDTMRHAEADDESGMEANIRKLRERHLETCIELLPAQHRDNALRGIH